MYIYICSYTIMQMPVSRLCTGLFVQYAAFTLYPDIGPY